MASGEQWGLLKEDPGANVAEIAARIVSKHPIEMEERIETLSRPLILECACPGWQPRQWPPLAAYGGREPVGYEAGGVRYPAVPCSVEEQAAAQVEAVRMGAAAVHIHPRDPRDCMATNDSGLLQQVYDRIYEQVDAISIQHTWKIQEDGSADYVRDAEAMIERGGGGNRYCQGAVVLWPPADSYPNRYAQSVQEGVRFMERHGIKPIHKLRGGYHVRQMKRVLIDTAVITKEPFVLVHDMGHPFGWPMDLDPYMPLDMITSLLETKQRVPNAIIGVFSGGRNWLPITMTAILAGVDFVRVGIEDVYWLYPHEDQVIQSNRQCVEKVIDFCRLIGRKIATVDEARAILGVRRTS